MPKLSHMLWFSDQAEEAVNLYTSIFQNSRVLNVIYGPDGAVLTVEFELFGSKYTALNGGPLYSFNEAFSIVILCDNQLEVDTYWDALIANGGQPGRCGWLKDKYGLSWQVVPKQLSECLGNPNPTKATSALNAMMGMSKLIISELEAAVR